MEKQLFLGSEPKREKFNPIRNIGFIKPSGGLWTSTLYNNNRSAWIDWCVNNDFFKEGHKSGWSLTVSKDAKILKIDRDKDLFEVYNKYGLNQIGFLSILDFEAIAKDYDGIWLTEEGQWSTRFSSPVSLYGWDCESVCWLNWVFEKVEHIEPSIRFPVRK